MVAGYEEMRKDYKKLKTYLKIFKFIKECQAKIYIAKIKTQKIIDDLVIYDHCSNIQQNI